MVYKLNALGRQTRLGSLDSHHHLRHWLPLSGLIAYSFQEPREIFTVPVLVLLARCTFCRHLPLFCSLLANIILPLSGKDQPEIIFFETNFNGKLKDRMSTGDWKAASAALDRNQPTTKFSTRNGNLNPNYGGNPLTDRPSGIGPMHGIEQ